MNALLPLWTEITVSVLLLAGSLITLVGCLALWRFPDFYQRMHGPTLGATLGLFLILMASLVYFTMTGGGVPAPHEILISTFLSMTVPATTLMLARAALYRHRRAKGERPPGGAVPPDSLESPDDAS